MTVQDLRDLHTETTADAFSAACAEGDCSGHPDDIECPVTEVHVCDYCYDHAGDPEYLQDWMLWPCETIRALDGGEYLDAELCGHEYPDDGDAIHVAGDTADLICLASPLSANREPQDEPSEAKVQAATHALSEWLNDNAPIGEAMYREPARAALRAAGGVQ